MLHRWAPPTQAIRLQTLEPDGLFAAQRVAAGRHPMRRPKWGASQSLPPSLPPVVEGRHGLETLSRLLFGAGRGHAPPATQWVATPIPPPLVQCAPQNKTAGDRDARPCTPAALRAAGTPPFRPPAPPQPRLLGPQPRRGVAPAPCIGNVCASSSQTDGFHAQCGLGPHARHPPRCLGPFQSALARSRVHSPHIPPCSLAPRRQLACGIPPPA